MQSPKSTVPSQSNSDSTDNESDSVIRTWFKNLSSDHFIFPFLPSASASFTRRTLSKNVVPPPAPQPPAPSLPPPPPPALSATLPLSSPRSTHPLIRCQLVNDETKLDYYGSIVIEIKNSLDEEQEEMIFKRFHHPLTVINDIVSTGECCENVLLLCFSCAGRYFHVVFCSATNGFNAGDQFNMPAKWQSLCKASNIEKANIRDGIVLRNIAFGEEIVVCNESEALLLERRKRIRTEKPRLEEKLELIAHEATDSEHNGGYKCDRCGKMFTYSYYREKHLKYARCVDQGDRKFRCSICPRISVCIPVNDHTNASFATKALPQAASFVHM
ncbi:unnamed protein product [Litomosoides sigmodontis]|uniref:C2H2-type domain-containing protein n=1 Tax=Litomosoides sigmodontis TaxID=42156 RepID=A0A3P6UT58_LITSI|nr:unnamed protein product [Litomosoides sigmodontis]